jgi:hypothetical protein
MNIMFSAELGRRLNGTGVVANCLDPGFNVTGLGRELPGAARLERILRFLGIGGPERGAAIITRLATDPQFAAVTGRYFSRNGDLIQPSPPGADKRLQGLLWDETERLLAPFCRATVMGGTLPDGSATRGHKAQAARDQ